MHESRNVKGETVKSRHIGSWMIPGLLSLMIMGCGFQPLYSQNGRSPAVEAELSAILVDVQKTDSRSDRLEQLVYSSLLDALTPVSVSPNPAWRLEIALEQTSKGVGFEVDDSATRFNLQIFGEWRLIDTATQAVVFSSSSRSIAAYNVVTSQFATLTAEKDAEERAAVDLANDIRLQLSLHFRKF